jgi:hypothetical protein
MNEIVPNLFVGTADDAASLGTVVPSGWMVISVTEYRVHYGRGEECPREPQGSHDMPFMLWEGELRRRKLDDIARLIAAGLDAGERVLVHCVKAHERSPLAVTYYLMHFGLVPDVDLAYTLVKRKHPETEDRRHWLP